MLKFADKLKLKSRSKKGVSLAEMLVCMIILLLVSATLASVVSLAVSQYDNQRRSSQSKILVSTLESAIKGELRFASKITVDNTKALKSFDSEHYYDNSTFGTDDDENDFGHIVVINNDDITQTANIVGIGSYSNGLTAKVSYITYDSENFVFEVKIEIGYKGDTYLTDTFQIKSANSVVATTA